MFGSAPNTMQRLMVIASKNRAERDGEDVSDIEVTEKKRPVDDYESESKPTEYLTDSPVKVSRQEKIRATLYEHMALIVDSRALPLVEDGLHALAGKLSTSVRVGTYDEIVKTVARVRKDLETINECAATIYRLVDKFGR
jgi:hypothetical protein